MRAWIACSTLVIVIVIAQDPLIAITQRFRCYPIRPGDTAVQIARRLTGDGVNQRASWFQIFDAERRLVSKRRYDDIHAGWRACIAEARPVAAPAPPVVEAVEATAGFEEQPRASVAEPSSIVADPVLWWLISFGLGGAAVALFAIDVGRKQAARARAMRRFGGAFVREFTR